VLRRPLTLGATAVLALLMSGCGLATGANGGGNEFGGSLTGDMEGASRAWAAHPNVKSLPRP
jgi:hypothetical protein